MADVLAEAVVELEADADKFNRDFKKSLKEAEKDAKKSTDEIDNSFKQMTGNLGKEFERATKEMARQFREQEREAKRVAREIEREAARVAREVEREARDAQREIERETARVARENERVQKEYEKEFIASQRAMEKAARESQERNAEHFRNSVTSLRRLASEKFSLTLGIDSSQISGALKSVTKLGAMLGVLGVGALAGQASAAGLAYITVAVQELAGAIALLPAAGAAAGIVVGTLTLGLRGLGDAIKADSTKELDEAFKHLSDNGKKFATTIRGLKDEFEDLGKSVQQALLAGFNVEVEKLGKVFLPILSKGFTSVAKELNLGARSIAEFVRESQTVQDVERIFDNTRQSVFVFRGALKPLAQAFRDLTVVGSEFLPVIAAELGGAAKHFGDFIKQARESGQLTTFFENAINAVKNLFSVIANVGGIFNAIMSAARASLGGGFLDLLANATQHLQDFLESARGQTALIQFFESAQEAGKLLLPILGDVARLILEVVLPAFVQIGKVAAPGLAMLVDGLTRGLQKAIPGIVSFVDSLSSVVVSLVDSGVLDALGDLVQVLGTSLGAAIRSIAPKLGDLVNSVLIKLADILPKLLPAVAKFAGAFADLVIAALPVVDILADIISSVGLPTLQRIAEQLTPVISKLADSLGDVLLPILPDLADAFSEWVDAMAPLVDETLMIFIDLLKTLVPLLPSIVRSGTELAKALKPIITLFSDITGFVSKFVTKLYEIPGAQKFLEEQLPKLLALITGTLIVPLGKLLELIDKIITKLDEAGVFDIIITALGFLGNALLLASAAFHNFGKSFDDAINFIKEVARTGVEFITSVIVGAFEGIKNFFITIWQSIKDAFNQAWEFIKSIARSAVQFVVSIVTGAFNQLPEAVQGPLRRMRDGAVDAFNGLLGFIRDIPSRIVSALGNLGSLLYGAGRDVVNGMINGITSAIGSLANTAANMASSALQAAKNALVSKSPSKKMMEVGEDFGQGFVIGIDSMLRQVAAAGADLASQTVMSTSSGLSPSDNSAYQMNEKLNRLTRGGLGSVAPAPASSDASAAQNTPTVVSPEIYVYIGDEEIKDYVTEVVDDRDRRKKISLSMGARRTL